ncbi:hypothetical protein C4B68_00175 [Streptomyces dengpaensis]|uniref:Uncharacterized protein n=1 Tax=Streptomyces dengpaensis TaxID=2049881 RepID=A0ABN5HTQ7_9ACTN|nr:hypothetical protein C4B68_00175 [Streptomyces dengpaensis]
MLSSSPTWLLPSQTPHSHRSVNNGCEGKETSPMIAVGSMTRSVAPSRSIREGSGERGRIWIVTPGASAARRRTSGPINMSTL